MVVITYSLMTRLFVCSIPVCHLRYFETDTIFMPKNTSKTGNTLVTLDLVSISRDRRLPSGDSSTRLLYMQKKLILYIIFYTCPISKVNDLHRGKGYVPKLRQYSSETISFQ